MPAGSCALAGGGTWTFDANGNRVGGGYVVGADNRLLSDGTWNYSYDKDGNVVGKVNISTGVSWAYGYDARDRMVSAVERDAAGTLSLQVHYAYDVFDHRIEEDVYDPSNGQTDTSRFAFNGDQVWAVLDGNNDLIERYVSLDGLDSAFADRGTGRWAGC